MVRVSPQTRSDKAAGDVEAGFLSPTVGTFIFACTVIGFAAIAVWLAAVLNLYIDEAYSLHTTDGGVAYAFRESLEFEQQPPLYFVALALWRTLGYGVFFARLTSVACSIATLFVVRDFARRQLANVPSWVPSLLVASNPFFLWAAVELRVYALIMLLSASLVSLFFRAFLASNDASTRRYRIIFTCVAVVAMYTQYFFAATLVGFCIVLVFFEWRRIPVYLAAMAVTIAALLPIVPVVRQQAQDASVETLQHPTALAIKMLSTIGSFALPHVWINALDIHAISIAYGVVFFLMAALAVVGIRRNNTVLALAILVGTLVAFFSGIILVAHEPIEMPRHITTVFIPLMLTIVAAVTSGFAISRRRNVLAIYLAIYAICAAAEDAHTYHPIVKIGDWTRVSRFLETNAKPSEPIAVFDAEAALPIRYTYRGPNRIVPLPNEQRFNGFDRRVFSIRSEAQLARSFPEPSPTTHRVWLVVSRPCNYPQLGNSCSLLADYVRSHFTTTNVTQFYDTAVYELERPHAR